MIAAGLTVFASDLEASRAFYADVLGFAVEDVADDAFVATLGEVEITVEGGARPRKRGRHWAEEAGVYVSLRTDDFDALLAGLVERGAPLLGGISEGADGRRYAGLADPDGVLYEIGEVS